MSDTEIPLEFKEVVELFDVTPRTLRHYEEIELIFPIRDGRKRFYTKREIARIKLILQGRRFGFKLEEIRQWLELYDPLSGNRKQAEVVVARASEQIEELEKRKGELDEAINDLQRYRDDTIKYIKTLDRT